MQVTPEQHELFASALTLLLPDPVWHADAVYRAEDNLTPQIIDSARRGNYYLCGLNRNWPYYFTANEYCGHLLPAVQELWRACYLAE